jgi:hypothetical protein
MSETYIVIVLVPNWDSFVGRSAIGNRCGARSVMITIAARQVTAAQSLSTTP